MNKIHKNSSENIFINGVYDVKLPDRIKKCLILNRMKDKFTILLSENIIKHIENKNLTRESIKEIFDKEININILEVSIQHIYKLHFVVNEEIYKVIKEAID